MTALETLPVPVAPRVPARDTGLRVPQIMLATLFASAGFNALLALAQQMAEYFTPSEVGEWFRYFAGATCPMLPA